MGKEERREKIVELEGILGSKVICFLTSDRPNTRMLLSRDCPKIIQQHLDKAEYYEKLSLYFLSLGGDLDVPWELVTLLRSHCKKLQVIIPYTCHSAATLFAIGCDELVVGRRGQLSPTDPTLHVRQGTDEKASTTEFGVEDINAFVKFVQGTLGNAFTKYGHEALNKLIDTVPPHLLGSINRNYFRSRLLIEKMLALSGKKYTSAAKKRIINLLTVGYFSHQHFISRAEMINELKLPVVEAEKLKIDGLIWDLYEDYANEFQSRKPFFSQAEFHNAEENPLTLELKGKYVESRDRSDVYVETRVLSGTAMPNFQFTAPQIEGVSHEALQRVVQHFSTELQQQLRPFLVAKQLSSFGEWKSE